MGWLPDLFGGSPRRSSSRPGYARSYAGSSYSGTSRHHASTSRYKRSPRDGYIAHLYAKLRHFMREIWRYAQRHPYKVFFMVIMPLVSGGVLHKLARQFGVNLPEMGGAGARGGHAGSRMAAVLITTEALGMETRGEEEAAGLICRLWLEVLARRRVWLGASADWRAWRAWRVSSCEVDGEDIIKEEADRELKSVLPDDEVEREEPETRRRRESEDRHEEVWPDHERWR